MACCVSLVLFYGREDGQEQGPWGGTGVLAAEGAVSAGEGVGSHEGDDLEVWK